MNILEILNKQSDLVKVALILSITFVCIFFAYQSFYNPYNQCVKAVINKLEYRTKLPKSDVDYLSKEYAIYSANRECAIRFNRK